MLAPALFSSRTDMWATPPALFAQLHAEFGFDLDVCAVAENAKCPRFFSPADDGLRQTWRGRCWMNPPYGRSIGRWVAKARESAATTAELVVCLLPARTCTAWFHDHILGVAEVRFIRGRVKFGDARHPAPFPSMLAVYRNPVRPDA